MVNAGAVVNSLPKAGTNLLAALLEELGYVRRGGLSAGMFLGSGVGPWLRRIVSLPFGQGVSVGIDCPVSVSRRYVERHMAKMEAWDYMTAHVGYSRAVLSIVEDESLDAFLVLRDPRAVLNSFVHYLYSEPSHMLNPDFSRLDRIDAYTLALRGGRCGRYYLEPLDVRCRALEAWRRAESVEAVRFEDLIGPRGGGSRTRQQEQIERVLRKLGLMEEASDADLEDLDPFSKGHTYRRGKIDAWRKEMPSAVQEETTHSLSSVLEDWGYESA